MIWLYWSHIINIDQSRSMCGVSTWAKSICAILWSVNNLLMHQPTIDVKAKKQLFLKRFWYTACQLEGDPKHIKWGNNNNYTCNIIFIIFENWDRKLTGIWQEEAAFCSVAPVQVSPQLAGSGFVHVLFFMPVPSPHVAPPGKSVHVVSSWKKAVKPPSTGHC